MIRQYWSVVFRFPVFATIEQVSDMVRTEIMYGIDTISGISVIDVCYNLGLSYNEGDYFFTVLFNAPNYDYVMSVVNELKARLELDDSDIIEVSKINSTVYSVRA